MLNLFAKLQLHIAANTRKNEHYINIFKAIDKYWYRAYYYHFY